MNQNSISLEIRIYGADGGVETFSQANPLLADKILNEVQPARLFTLERIVIAGTYSLTALVPARLTRIDFVRPDAACWAFPAGILDLIELSEEEFRGKAHLNEVEKLEVRTQERASGEFAVGFLDIAMVGGLHVYLAMEFVVELPAERLQRINFLFSAPTLHFRLREGGIGALNLGNLIRFTAYPGPAQAPSNAWPAHHQRLAQVIK